MGSAEKWEVITCDDGRLIIATAGDIVCHQDPNHQTGDVTDARRFHLIATAPAMLEACRKALTAMQKMDRYDVDAADTLEAAVAAAEAQP